ncbi:MAG TPA: TM0106 family RecB-like putative nuclease, partial [Casimicrobiaceae bacterium]|nr:TM0106 family RecB-like putative nuclease [Casimicrobiaceae bacterium]
MRAVGPNIELSASDLSYFLACRHRSALDLAVARGLRSAPDWIDPAIEILRQRGLEHERRYTDRLRAQGLAVAELAAHEIDGAAERSIEAMRAGADVILQPALRNASWFGRPDLLRRVAKPSALGSWSYEVHDTKLANETSAGTILQLALYSDLLANVQGLTPEFFHVVTPNTALQTYRFDDFSAYFRLVRRRLESTVSIDPRALLAANYPEPVKHCDVCRWWRDCDRRRREDDHLSLVAGMSRLHAHELERAGLGTLTQLGGTPLSLDFKPVRGARESYERMHDQARVQLAGRIANAPVHELLPSAPDRGFSRLPLPSTKDLFLDIEGDPFARP